jgi:hypothetical protein
MHESPQIGEEVGNPEIPKLRLAKGGNARTEKLVAHRKMKSPRCLIVIWEASSHESLVSGEWDQLALADWLSQ